MRTTMLPAAKRLRLRLVAALLAGHIARDRRRQLLHLHVLALQHLHQLHRRGSHAPSSLAIT